MRIDSVYLCLSLTFNILYRSYHNGEFKGRGNQYILLSRFCSVNCRALASVSQMGSSLDFEPLTLEVGEQCVNHNTTALPCLMSVLLSLSTILYD